MMVPAEAVLMVAGLHEPVMPLPETAGRVPGVAPTQYGPSWVKVGAMLAVTTISIVVGEAHWPAVGVNE